MRGGEISGGGGGGRGGDVLERKGDAGQKVVGAEIESRRREGKEGRSQHRLANSQHQETRFKI